MSALIPERFVAVTPTLVREYGANAAIVLQEIHFRSLDPDAEDSTEVEKSHAQLAHSTGLSTDQVYRALKKLSAAKVIAIAHNFDENGNRRPSTYRVVNENLPPGPLPRFRGTPPAIPRDPYRDSAAPPSRDSAEHKKKAVSKNEELLSYTAEFERFWAAYPKREGSNPKKAAFRCWRARLREGVQADDLISAALQYANTRRNEDPKFTKMASTYLGPDEHWKTDLEVVQMNRAAAGQGEAPKRRVPCPRCFGSSFISIVEDNGQSVAAPCDHPNCVRGSIEVDALPLSEEPF